MAVGLMRWTWKLKEPSRQVSNRKPKLNVWTPWDLHPYISC